MTKTLNTTGWERCNICGLVIWNSELHLNYSHPKKKKACEVCSQSGKGQIQPDPVRKGVFVVSKCEHCNGAGYYDLEERV